MFFKLTRFIAATACLVVLVVFVSERYASAEEETNQPEKTVDMSITLGLLTRHVKPSDDTNDDSDFLALSYKKFSMARFINSYHDETWFGGLNYHTSKLNLFEGSDIFLQGNLYPGLVYGYKDHLPNLFNVTPILIPTLGLGYKRVNLELLFFPSPAGGVFSAALRFDLGWRETSESHDTQSGTSTPVPGNQ